MSISAVDYQNLSVTERLQLVEDIWDSIASETPDAIVISHSQRQEIQRRVAEHDANPDSAISWDVVREELFRQNS
jgi:putative addiction module component (TIGR02574 family)